MVEKNIKSVLQDRAKRSGVGGTGVTKSQGKEADFSYTGAHQQNVGPDASNYVQQCLTKQDESSKVETNWKTETLVNDVQNLLRPAKHGLF